jgi:malate dehydrogenase (quinone)
MTRGTQYYDVLIVGAGVTGTSIARILNGEYGDFGKVGLIERREAPALVNSNPRNNSQTSHDGSTETNHDLAEALKILPAARAIRRFIDNHPDKTLSYKNKRMVIGVGEEEVALLEQRYRDFKPHYDDLNLVYGDTLAEIEPKVMEGRDPRVPICALVSDEGYAINYQRLSQVFLEESPSVETHFNVEVLDIVRGEDGYRVTTNTGEIVARYVIFGSGPYSLSFAQKLGYGQNLGIMPVAGSFFSAGSILRNKVYTVQLEGIPFAAIHGDPDVVNQDDTRFGPTVKILPLMERDTLGTFFEFAHTPMFSIAGLRSVWNTISDRQVFWFAFKSAMFDIPIIGQYLFWRDAQKIVPSLKFSDIKLRKGAGGIRPQIVNLKTREVQMGEAIIVGDNVIFYTTPSPGASVCWWNARNCAIQLAKFAGDPKLFDQVKFDKAYAPELLETNH